MPCLTLVAQVVVPSDAAAAEGGASTFRQREFCSRFPECSVAFPRSLVGRINRTSLNGHHRQGYAAKAAGSG